MDEKFDVRGRLAAGGLTEEVIALLLSGPASGPEGVEGAAPPAPPSPPLPPPVLRGRAAFERWNPLRHPDWRWRHARELANTLRRPLVGEDRQLVRAFGYIQGCRASFTDPQLAAVEARKPDIAEALRLELDGGLVTAEIRARLLAGELAPDIARKTGLAVASVQTYADLFYDVTPFLKATDWILQRALKLSPASGQVPSSSQLLGFYAYFGGTVVLDTLLRARSHPLEELEPSKEATILAKAAFLLAEWTADWTDPATAKMMYIGWRQWVRGRNRITPDRNERKARNVQLKAIRLYLRRPKGAPRRPKRASTPLPIRIPSNRSN